MGNKNLTRRHFFRSLAAPADTGTQDDPLFEKYSRKKLTTRHYSTDEVQLKVGTEEDTSVAQRTGNPVTSGLNAYAGTWTEWEVLHLLRRTNFGWKKAWVDALLPLTPSAAVDAVLNINNTPPSPPVNWYQNIANNADENNLPYGADWTNDFFPTNSVGQTTNSNRNSGMRRWLFGLILNGDATIREKMVWFWYHFIPIDFDTIYQSSNAYINTNSARFFYRYFKLFRDNALGNFKTLIRAVAVEPGMMYYLNNQQNSATAPDENFARELMELFTLGKDDPNNTYAQSDVVAAAQVLTGWRVQSINTANPATNFVSGSHKQGNKTFSSFFNNTVITGQTGAAGANELDALINMIFSKQVEVSKYICRRLYRYFVYYDIDANIEANVIAPLAQTFVANNWNIQPVLNQLFKSEHFFDMANRGCYIKSPFDLVGGAINMLALNTTDANIEYQYRIWSKYNDGYCLSMEQQMGTIPNVSGWNAYYQTPAYHEYWINSNSVQKRFTFIQDMFNGHTVGSVYSGGTTLRSFKVDPVAFALSFGNAIARDPNALTAICIKYLLPIDLSQGQKDQLKGSTLLSGQSTDSYWTTAWDTWYNNQTSANRSVIEPRLKNLLSGICQLAEYQLM
ncbi:DUF1800 domain-containing protein [Flavisolibacter ginsenosidimutans]|uniref:DUF1800 domain-containing protein n=1 Tax=Flavisolibacter ginsenosidimutans TaxID=661481 RepID=A0A5B8UMG0_9BACT|nr:DUF1800 family protein [Flavisolibacter ginsenosidimutans]QEC57552.1 DUF1800 domain-containing protein [Flavisolibacter ginsenosidimutans]